MESDAATGKSAPGEAAFVPPAQRFDEVLRAFLSEATRSTGGASNVQLLAQRLAAELERWLRDAASMPAWLQNLQYTAHPLSAFARPFNPGPFAAPFGPDNEILQGLQGTVDLLKRCSELQVKLAFHWSTIARRTGEEFSARATTLPLDLELHDIKRLYDSWIDCAERAYAATVHTDEFCRTQADLINTMTVVLLEQRRQAESFAQSLGLSTRSELNALQLELKQLQARVTSGTKRRTHKARRKRSAT